MSEVNIAEMGVDPDIIRQTPGLLSGVPVFAGTRLPVRLLLDYLIGGRSIDFFLESYDSVGREEVVRVLELVFERTIGPRDSENPFR